MKNGRLFLLVLSLFFSCAQTDEQELLSAKEQAKAHLTAGECNDAIDVLDDVGYQDDDADYISLYASAHACLSGFKEVDFFTNDITTVSATNLVKSLASMSTSNETQADSTGFLGIMTAINAITSASTTSAGRVTRFGTSKGTDLNFQLLSLSMVATGKWFAYYGNVGTDGTKGGDAQALGNTCIYSYTNANAVAWITTHATANAVGTGTCTAATGSEGSDQLESPVTAATIKTRLCYGIVAFNNFLETVSNLDVSGDDFGQLDTIETAVSTLYTAAETLELAQYSTTSIQTMKVIYDQASCESANLNDIERYYAIFFEADSVF